MASVRRETEDIIRPLIEDYLAAPAAIAWQQDLARRHDVLPLFWEWTVVYALAPSGEVVTITTESRDVVDDERLRNMALKQGAKSFAALEWLIPAPPPDALLCQSCEGRGSVGDAIICWCGGTGWLPPTASQMPRAAIAMAR
jgi:hypothetical protein